MERKWDPYVNFIQFLWLLLDILEDNAIECRDRLFQIFSKKIPFYFWKQMEADWSLKS